MQPTVDPIAFALDCAARGDAVALVTLVAIEGSGPRHVGTQLCVTADRRAAGSLSGGCLDKAVIAEAQAALLAGQARTLSFGPGSEFADLQLPCGSRLQLHIDAPLNQQCLMQLATLRANRCAYQWRWQDHQPQLATIDSTQINTTQSNATTSDGDSSGLCYYPNLVVHVAGSAAAMLSFCKLCQASDVGVIAYTPDATLRGELQASSIAVAKGFTPPLDRYSAAITLFHEHEYELPFLRHALSQDALYVGAMGSAKAQASRKAQLLETGVTLEQLSKLRGHIGLIARARTPQLLAVSILAEIMQCYQRLIDPN